MINFNHISNDHIKPTKKLELLLNRLVYGHIDTIVVLKIMSTELLL